MLIISIIDFIYSCYFMSNCKTFFVQNKAFSFFLLSFIGLATCHSLLRMSGIVASMYIFRDIYKIPMRFRLRGTAFTFIQLNCPLFNTSS